MTYREIIEVGQEEEHTNDSNQTEEDTAHRSLAPSRGIHLAPTVTSKSRQSHEASTHDVGNPKRNKLTIRTERHVLYAFPVPTFAASETLRSDRRFEEAEQRDQETGTHRFSDVFHVCRYEGEMKGERGASVGLNIAQD